MILRLSLGLRVKLRLHLSCFLSLMRKLILFILNLHVWLYRLLRFLSLTPLSYRLIVYFSLLRLSINDFSKFQRTSNASLLLIFLIVFKWSSHLLLFRLQAFASLNNFGQMLRHWLRHKMRFVSLIVVIQIALIIIVFLNLLLPIHILLIR